MKLLAFSSRAISSFIFDAGMSTRRCFDPHALRIRVNMSAIGSVMLIERFPVFPMVSARFRGLLRSESAVTASNRFLVVGHWFLAVANDQRPMTKYFLRFSFHYHEAFRTPGISPIKAISRNAILESPNVAT